MMFSVIICGKWAEGTESEYTGQAANVLFLSEAPHDWLFPKCSVIIHHGGSGTTGGINSSPRLCCQDVGVVVVVVVVDIVVVAAVR